MSAPIARRNRRDLARRAVMMLALWLGFWLLALGLVAGLFWIPFAQSHYGDSLEVSGILAGFAGLTLAYALRPRGWFKREKKELPTWLDRSQAEPLYALVERIGAKAGFQAHVDIHLMGAASAYISAQRNWRGGIKSLRVGLGLPLFAWLSEEELSSVIAHEFGHFAGGDLSLGPWVYRTRASIGATIADLDESMFFLDALFRLYGHWFLKLSSSVSRAQEFSADALAARYFGADATRSALEKVHLIDPAWSAYLDYELGPAIMRGARVPIFEGFRRFCLPGIKRSLVQSAIEKAERRPTAIYDTHPSLEERVAALKPGAKPVYPPPRQCVHLLGGEQPTENAWYINYKPEELRTVAWDEYGTDILKPRMLQRFTDSWMDPAKLPLTELIQFAEDPDSLWERLRPDGVSFLSPAGKRKHVLDVLEDWITVSLFHRGFVPVVHPGRELELRRESVSAVPSELLHMAREGLLRPSALAKFEPLP
ncbi:M48 family metallopeptidase [Undibacterium sp.]|uniref:M48 family metallopeptidase n=1 Tax=Undibacterium sp. TaxID=1914977 RepID=UPI00374DF811